MPLVKSSGIAKSVQRRSEIKKKRLPMQTLQKVTQRPGLRQALKAGYQLEWLVPSKEAKVYAAIAGRKIQPLPKFVRLASERQ